MSRPQTVTAAGVLLLVVGANVAVGGAALAVLLFCSPASPCLCLACPFSLMLLAAGLGCLRVGGILLAGRVDGVGAVASVALAVGALVTFAAGVLLSKELPRFMSGGRPRTIPYTLEVGAVALAFADGTALVVAGALLAAGRHRYAGWRPTSGSPDFDPPPLPGRSRLP